MRRILPFVMSFGLVVGASSMIPLTADAAPKSYKNCTELNKAYKGGVARAANIKNKGGKTYHKSYVSKALHDVNSKLDRDKGLIACEK
ncbi:excalibur calcium-binding domain-containing protein [Priestia flexa]|uniref:excalibur calcium-binding domain-containing protein n=1 Tax=Priestia flexa TaxID=86664 RepID=UPI0032EB8AA3